MPSAIDSIYTAIKNISVTVGSVTPTAYGLTGLPNQIASADLPARLILAVGGALATGQQAVQFYTLSDYKYGAKWQINDLMLWIPQEQGRGVAQVAQSLVQYAGAYLDAVRTNRDLTALASIEDMRAEPGLYEYPQGSGITYFGCMATVTVQEWVE